MNNYNKIIAYIKYYNSVYSYDRLSFKLISIDGIYINFAITFDKIAKMYWTLNILEINKE
jgi:hypothetical protein